MVVGFCDPACTDLDLSILDPVGEEVGNDYLPDPQPVLMLTPKISGTFQIQVEMVTCSAEPCEFAVGILEGEIPAELGLMGGDMEDRLNLFRSNLEGEGFTEVGSPEAGSLDADQEMRFPLALAASVEYRLAGVCDNDCDDLDLILYGPAGEEVASDLLVDAVPMLTLTPTSTGTYRLAVVMVGCRIGPCGFMVGIFAKGEGLGPVGVPVAGNVLLAETHQGNLEEGDDQMEEGEFYDEYSIQAQAGQTILLDLRSPDFDTFLILQAPGGDEEQNDDWEGDSMHSRIELVAPETGTYAVRVTSFIEGETGAYTLEVAVVEGGG